MFHKCCVLSPWCIDCLSVNRVPQCWLSWWQWAAHQSHAQQQQTGVLKVTGLLPWWMSDQIAFLNYLVSILCCSMPGHCTALLPWDVTRGFRLCHPKMLPTGTQTIPLYCTHHQLVLDQGGCRSPPLPPSPSWLIATGIIIDYFPIALSDHRNAELDTIVVFFSSSPTLTL